MDPMQSNKRPGMACGIVYNLVFQAGALTNMLYVDLFVQSQVIKVIYL